MVESGIASASGVASLALRKQAFRMLFSLDAGEGGTWLDASGMLALEARNSLEAEHLELLECVREELNRSPRSASGGTGHEVCIDLLAHLAGCSMGERAATVH